MKEIIYNFFMHPSATKVLLIFSIILPIITIVEWVTKKESVGTKFFKWVIGLVKAPYRAMQTIRSLLDMFTVLDRKVTEIKSEVTYNGGTFKLRDALEANNKKTNEIFEMMSLIGTRVDTSFYLDDKPMFVTNLKGELLRANTAWEDITGGKEEEMLGLNYMRAIPIEAHPAMNAERERLAANPTPYSGEVPFKNIKTKDVILTYCNTRLAITSNGAEEIWGTLKIISIEKFVKP